MPYFSQGLTFGNFSVVELEELFGSGALRNTNRPPVEFLFEFEADYEDQVGETRKDGASVDGNAKSAPNGPDDSGVEVGQESEQESLPPHHVPAVACVPTAAQSGREQGSQKKAKDGSLDISFGGASVIEDKDVFNSNASPTILQDAENFPPLGGLQVQEVDRSRRRRRKRKQHQRSGDVPCSSSEDSDRDRSPAGSTERVPRGRSGSGMLPVDKGNAATESKKTAPVTTERGAAPKASKDLQDTNSSTDTKSTGPSVGDASSSPVQSDADNQSNNHALRERGIAQSDSKPVAEVKPKQEEAPKVVKSSWADLFRNTAKPAAAVVIVSPPLPAPKVEVPTPVNKKAEEAGPSVIPVDEDKQAITIAEMLKNANLNNDAKHIFLRGLINRANWCYINTTLQALLACPPFFNLLRQIQPLENRQATSTPILDSLVKFVHEFNIVSRQVNLPPGGKNNKSDFRTGSSFEPSYVYKMLSTIESTLSVKGRQEDAEEFLSHMLNGIHEEMLKVDKLLQPVAEPQSADLPASDDPSIVAVEGEDLNENEDTGDWEQVGPRNKSSITRMATFPKSLLSDIFGGFLRSSLHQAGTKESANVEPFFCLQLDIQNVTCIEEALNHLTVKEELQGFTCSKTKAQIDVSRRVSFEVLPKILILHLKRFIYSKTGCQKSQRHIDYPLDLVIGKELLSPNVRGKFNMAQKTYKLCAVVYHHGKMASGGHYTADINHPAHGWVHTDDTKLKPVPPGYVLKPAQGKDPYLLYYRRTDQIS